MKDFALNAGELPPGDLPKLIFEILSWFENFVSAYENFSEIECYIL